MAQSTWVHKTPLSFWISLAVSLGVALVVSYLRFWRNR